LGLGAVQVGLRGELPFEERPDADKLGLRELERRHRRVEVRLRGFPLLDPGPDLLVERQVARPRQLGLLLADAGVTSPCASTTSVSPRAPNPLVSEDVRHAPSHERCHVDFVELDRSAPADTALRARASDERRGQDQGAGRREERLDEDREPCDGRLAHGVVTGEGLLVDRQVADAEADEADELNRGRLAKRLRTADRDPRGSSMGYPYAPVLIDGNAMERTHARVLERGTSHSIAARVGLARAAPAPDGAHGVDHVARGKPVALGDPRFARRTAAQRLAFREKLRPAARWMAPSTPPPPRRVEFAAFTMASTRIVVMSLGPLPASPSLVLYQPGSRGACSPGSSHPARTRWSEEP